MREPPVVVSCMTLGKNGSNDSGRHEWITMHVVWCLSFHELIMVTFYILDNKHIACMQYNVCNAQKDKNTNTSVFSAGWHIDWLKMGREKRQMLI